MFKLAVTAGTHAASPQALVVFRGLDESVPLARESGHDGLEIAVAARQDIDSRSLRVLLARHQMEVPVFSTGRDGRALGSEPQADEKAEIGRVELDFGAAFQQRRERTRAFDRRAVLVRPPRRRL